VLAKILIPNDFQLTAISKCFEDRSIFFWYFLSTDIGLFLKLKTKGGEQNMSIGKINHTQKFYYLQTGVILQKCVILPLKRFELPSYKVMLTSQGG